MKKILILYSSGAGATKKVAGLMYNFLSQICKTDMFSIESKNDFDINNYNALIIGTPVYHAAPSHVITDYFSNINQLDSVTPVFIYNTRAICSCNTNRILAKQLKQKNIITIMDRDYRSPASDGSLIMPSIQRLFEFEKGLSKKISFDCNMFLGLLQRVGTQGYIPHFRFSSIINAPNKLAGQIITFKIYTHYEKCIKCEKCVRNCPHHALEKDSQGYPVFIKENCENCYRCIHHCPAKALSLSKLNAPKKLLVYDESGEDYEE